MTTQLLDRTTSDRTTTDRRTADRMTVDRRPSGDDILWDRRGPSRLARTDAFRLLAAVGRRTSDRTAGILMQSRIARTAEAIVIECRPEHVAALVRHEPAIADAVEHVFGKATRLDLLTMPLFQATA